MQIALLESHYDSSTVGYNSFLNSFRLH